MYEAHLTSVQRRNLYRQDYAEIADVETSFHHQLLMCQKWRPISPVKISSPNLRTLFLRATTRLEGTPEVGVDPREGIEPKYPSDPSNMCESGSL